MKTVQSKTIPVLNQRSKHMFRTTEGADFHSTQIRPWDKKRKARAANKVARNARRTNRKKA